MSLVVGADVRMTYQVNVPYRLNAHYADQLAVHLTSYQGNTSGDFLVEIRR
jgi:hypothetical protein